MKHLTLRKYVSVLLAALMVFALTSAAFAVDVSDGFRYHHDPRLNPAAMADIIVDPDAIYGFAPNPESTRLGEYAKYDWSDAELIAGAKQSRIEYHESIQELYDLKNQLAAEGKGIEEIARAVSGLRNEIRLRSYEDNPEALASAKASNLATYGNELGPTADSLFEKYGSWQVVLEKAFSTNSGMDACLGLYDEYFDVYTMIGQILDWYYYDAMQWAYDTGLAAVLSDAVCDPDALCTRAQAVMLLWEVSGCPEAADTEIAFTDVAADSVYAAAIQWAAAEDIVRGVSEDAFAPDATVTRAQFITLLSRLADADEDAAAENPFSDVADSAYYYDAVIWAAAEGITTGTGNAKFTPDSESTCAEVITFLWRYSTAA